MKQNKLAIYAIHPIMYQIPIFKEMDKYISENSIDIDNTVLFGDDLSLKNSFNKEFKTSFSYGNWLIKGYKHKFLKNYSFDARSGFFSRINFGIFRELKNEKYDVILIHGYESCTSWLTLFSAKILGIKIIWRGEAVLRGIETNNTLKQKLKKSILKFFFKKCDSFIYSCTGNKEYLKFYGVDEEKIFSIPCAVNNDFFQAEKKLYDDKIVQVKKELGIPLDDLVILFSARFTSRKRPFDLLNALKKIDHSNITILFVGDGLERSKMEEFVSYNKLKAKFVGFKSQNKISKYYSISDIDVVISDYDPSPKAMNEAMNFSLPIIVTDVVGTANDLVKDGENGFIVRVGDIDTISKKLDYLNKNRDKLKIMGEKSFDIVQHWNYKEDVKGILKAFEYVMENKD